MKPTATTNSIQLRMYRGKLCLLKRTLMGDIPIDELRKIYDELAEVLSEHKNTIEVE